MTALSSPAAQAVPISPLSPCPQISVLTIEHHDGGRLPEISCSPAADGGIVLTAGDGWSVPLPSPGMQVTQTAALPAGHTEFIVRRTTAGEVEALFVDTSTDHGDHGTSPDPVDDDAPGPYQGGAPDRCADARWSSLGHWVYGPMAWSYNPTGAPTGVVSTSEAAFVAGYDNVAAGRDGCNVERTALLTVQAYLGTTTVPTDVSASRTCTSYDGVNVAGWVRGGTGYLGLACVWSYVDAGHGPGAIDADIVLNTAYAWSTGPTFSGSQYDVSSVVAHEAGHVFGLGHAGDSAHPSQLTMSGSGVYAGSIYARLLGAGDLQGLTAMYGGMDLDR
jgi:hypothetical protein